MDANIFSMQALKDNIAELRVQPGKKTISVLYPEDITDDKTFLDLVKQSSPRKEPPVKKQDEKPQEKQLTKA